MILDALRSGKHDPATGRLLGVQSGRPLNHASCKQRSMGYEAAIAEESRLVAERRRAAEATRLPWASVDREFA
jgi:hypothetical protein